MKAAKNPFCTFGRGLSSNAHSAGERVRALNEEMQTDTAIEIENCWNSRPVLLPMHDTGINTASSTTVVATIGDETLCIASTVACFALSPFSILTCTASTTTIASSTTRPMASTIPNSEMILIENPSSGKSAKAPMIDTGIASSGMSVARQSCRKRKMMAITRIRAIMSVTKISFTPASILVVASTIEV